MENRQRRDLTVDRDCAQQPRANLWCVRPVRADAAVGADPCVASNPLQMGWSFGACNQSGLDRDNLVVTFIYGLSRCGVS